MHSVPPSPFPRPSFSASGVRADPPRPPNLRDCYCAEHGLAPVEFERVLLASCLPPHARLLRPLLERLLPGYFAGDMDFLRTVGALRNRRDFTHEAREYLATERQRGGWRYRLHLRVSVARVRQRVDACWARPSSPSRGPA